MDFSYTFVFDEFDGKSNRKNTKEFRAKTERLQEKE